MLLVLSFADGFPGWLVRTIRKDKSSLGRTGTLLLLMLRASVLLMYLCVWGWIGCEELLLVSLMGDIPGGWWGVYSSTCQCWITQTLWLPRRQTQKSLRMECEVPSNFNVATSRFYGEQESTKLHFKGNPPKYLFIYVFTEVYHGFCWSCHNLINQCGILQQITNSLLIEALLLSVVSTGWRMCHAFAFILKSLRMLFVEVW